MSEQEIKRAFSRKADEYTDEEMVWILVDLTGCCDDDRKAMFNKIAKIIGLDFSGSKYDKAEFVKEWNSGTSTLTMATKYKTSQDNIRSRAKILKNQGYDIVLRRQNITIPNLSEQIISLRSSGLSFAKIGKQLGISTPTAYKYANKTPHVTGNNVESN